MSKLAIMEITKDIDKLLKDINRVRKTNKDSWYFISGQTTSGMNFKIKAFNTWIQKLEIGDLTYSSGMDIKVSEFNDFLRSNLK